MRRTQAFFDNVYTICFSSIQNASFHSIIATGNIQDEFFSSRNMKISQEIRIVQKNIRNKNFPFPKGNSNISLKLSPRTAVVNVSCLIRG